MADHTVGDGVVGSSSNFQANSGDSELDEKIAEWLHLDKVTYFFPNIKYAYLPHTYTHKLHYLPSDLKSSLHLTTIYKFLVHMFSSIRQL